MSPLPAPRPTLTLRIEPDAAAAASTAAELIVAFVRERPRCVLGLATGRTFEPVYAGIARAIAAGRATLRDVVAFLLDEYRGATPDDPWSFHAYARRHLQSRTDLPLANLRGPDACAPDAEGEAARYEREIAAAGGIDLQLLGIGRNGHLGFNEPGSPLAGRAGLRSLARETRDDLDHALFAGASLPTHGITLGLGSIGEARQCLLVATGAHKALALRAALESEVCADCPASSLQHHARVVVVADRPAASLLSERRG